MRKFDINEAKAGKPVCTRCGRKARIICFDARNDQPIVALIEDADNRYEIAYNYDLHGKWDEYEETGHDLMMAEDEKPKCPFKPFDKVLVRDDDDDCFWNCTFFSNILEENGALYYYCNGFAYNKCIPYNEETEHLIGTTDAPPEKYVIW